MAKKKKPKHDKMITNALQNTTQKLMIEQYEPY
jgi:hypothetical protein